MLGAIAGDVIGSFYEIHTTKSKNFELFNEESVFTDDTVLTIAVADAILTNSSYALKIKEYANLYPNAGYGLRFWAWSKLDTLQPYNSWGNGSAMRVSAVGFAFDDLGSVLKEAEKTAQVTHNHPEGIKGAKATASAIFLARQGKSKAEIKNYIERTFNYNLSKTWAEIQPYYEFEVSCQKSVPEAIICFLESESYEDAIRNAVALGGDADTQACIAGGIAEAFYGEIPHDIVKKTLKKLTPSLRFILKTFQHKYIQEYNVG